MSIQSRSSHRPSSRPARLPTALGTAVSCLLTSLILAFPSRGRAEDVSAQEVFFESEVRPLLLDHCVSCHGPDEQAGQLRLDRRSAVGDDDGSAAVVPGNPDESLLVRAVRYDDAALQMPPDGKLDDEQIAVLTAWVRSGAYWPQGPEGAEPMAQSPAERIDEFRQSHWAYQKIVAEQPPAVDDTGWPQQALDRFVLARLEDEGLAPNPRADRRTLIHRAYFTLIGLPPPYEEVEAFVNDPSPDALPRLVDRLLDSRHYGERWARHWLDLARYADTTGYFGSRDTRYPYAYTYRDYVIAAFNDDKPFDRFILEQLAADQLQLSADQQQALAAMGLLTVGRRFMNRQHDIIDDRIDVVTRGFLGLSVSCARCHDHKYDPIPTADYYSLYGVFASSHEPDELPLLGDPADAPGYDDFLAAQAEKQRQVDAWVEERRIATEDELRSRVADYLVYLAKTLPQYDSGDVKKLGERGALRPRAVSRWQQYVAGQEETAGGIWALWHVLARWQPEEFAERAAELFADAAALESLGELHPGLMAALGDEPPETMVEAAERIGKQLEVVYGRWKQTLEEDGEIERLADEHDERLRGLLFAAEAPTSLDTEQMIAHLDQGERNTYNRKLGEVQGVEVTHPGAPPRGMVLVDKPQPHEPVIFRRGQPGNRGDRVPRRFLQVLSHVDGGQPFGDGSGRLELARAIASPDNPLTPRVIVNRIWQHHFGVGLVPTASDFGVRGEPPTHPKLLDHLAAEFVADGWSIKRLQRRIMLSSTWQQSSQLRAEAHRADPENRLLWHMPRRRLEFEPLRDRLLVAADRLDLRIGGRSVMIHQDAPRRGLYAYIDREDMPGLLASFDLPSPDASQAKRAETTVPQQALYLMNAGFVIRQAEALAELTAGDQSPQQRIAVMYRRALARDPDAEELRMASNFIASAAAGDDDTVAEHDDHEPRPVWRFGYGHFNDADDTVDFTPLPHFSGDAWQASPEFPDAEFSYLRLTAGGGHPGNSDRHSTILRWVAPGDGVVAVRGRLQHGQDAGDGVRGRLVSAQSGPLGHWDVFNGEAATRIERIEVQAGEMLDFIVEPRGSASHDSYRWSPVIRSIESLDERMPAETRWDAAADFATASRALQPPAEIDPWVQLAQVLLVCNEFAFVD